MMKNYVTTYRVTGFRTPKPAINYEYWYTNREDAEEHYHGLIDNGFGTDRVQIEVIDRSYKVTVICYPKDIMNEQIFYKRSLGA